MLACAVACDFPSGWASNIFQIAMSPTCSVLASAWQFMFIAPSIQMCLIVGFPSVSMLCVCGCWRVAACALDPNALQALGLTGVLGFPLQGPRQWC